MNKIDSFLSKLGLSQLNISLFKNIYWALLGKICNLASGLIVGIIVARYLGPEKYGLMNYVISYVFLFQTIAIFGLDSIEVREESKNEAQYNKIIGTAFILKIVLGCIFIAVTIITSIFTERDSYTTILIAIYSITIVLNSFSVIRNYFTSIVQNEYIVKAEISRTLLAIIIKLCLLFFKANLTIFVIAYATDYILLASGYYVSYKYKIGKISIWEFDKSIAVYLLKESFPLMLTSTAVFIYQRIDQVMIGQMIDKQSVGYFSVASRFVEIIMYIPMTLAQTIMPVLVKVKEQSYQAYELKGQQFMSFSFWFTLITCTVVSLLAYFIVNITFGIEYLPAVPILQIMAFKAATVALSNTAGTMLIAEGLQKYAIFRDITGCLVCLLLNYLLLPLYGIMAAAFVALASNFAAGYLADAFIPAYRHIFYRQCHTLFLGWTDIIHIKHN